MGHYANAFDYLTDANEMEPSDYETLILLGAVMAEVGDYTSALDALQRSLNIEHNADAIAMIGYVYALKGKRTRAAQMIKELKLATRSHEHLIKIAQIYAVLAETDTALRLLEQAIERREADVTAITFDPRWKKIRDEPRFQALVKGIGLSK